MKTKAPLACLGLLILLSACVSPGKPVALQTVGPDPTVSSRAGDDGYLRVYSARERAVIDPNAEAFFWNNDFGRNDFLHGAAHSSYTLANAAGQVFKTVPNANGSNDSAPALVPLPPGHYQVHAAAEEYDAATFQVVVPVVIEAGRTTDVRLERR